MSDIPQFESDTVEFKTQWAESAKEAISAENSICVNGVLKHVNTPDSYLRERCANIGDSVRSLA